MTKMIVFFVILLSLFVIQSANAQTDTTNTQIIQTIQGNLAYIDITKPNNVYTQPIAFDPPDGLSKIISAEIIIQGDFQANTIVSAKIGDAYCEPSRWTTPRYDTAGYRMTFECTFLGLDKTKDIQFNFVTDLEAKNLKGWYKISYYNDWKLPDEIAGKILKPTMQMHGTEYDVGTFGKVWLQLLDSNGAAVNNGTCYVDVYYPYGSLFITKACMMFLSDGIYEYDFMVPNAVGVYPAVATCYYTTTTLTETADAGSIINGTNKANSYVSTQISDDTYWDIEEALVGGIRRVAFIENFTNLILPSQLTGVTVKWEGRWNGGTDFLTIYIKNFTTNTWVALSNTIADTGAADAIITNSIDTSNASASGLLSSTNETRIMIADTTAADTTTSKVKTDYLAVEFVYLSGVTRTEIRGSSEIHATSRRKSLYVIVYDDCGEIDEDEAGTCGSFVDYNNQTNYLENEIEVNLTVQSISSENGLDTEWVYHAPITQDCTSIYSIQYLNGTVWQDVTSQAQMLSDIGDENCHIKMPLIVDIGGTYQYRILMDNYMKWEIAWVKSVRDLTYGMIYPLCTAYATANNYTFTVPILKGTFVNNTDMTLSGCHKFLDDVYWIDNFYGLSQNTTSVAEYTSYYLELRWYETALRQHNQLYTSNLLMTFYSSESAKNITLDNIWNYANRSLETFGLRYVGGTEYNTNDTVQVSTQFLRSSGANLIPVNDAQCNVTIFYPNRSIFLFNMNATLISGSNGIYSYNFIAPSTEGIYHADFRCDKPSPSSTVYSSGTFHVAPWANSIYMINPFMNSINNSLYFLIYNVNNSIYMRIDQINDSITNKIDSVNSNINSMNSSLYNLMLSINASIIGNQNSINSSLFGKLNDMNNLMYSLNSSLYIHMSDINISIFNKLVNMQSKLDEIYNIDVQINNSIANLNITLNTTALENMMLAMNQSIHDKITESENMIYAINNSIISELYVLQTQLADINLSIYDRFGQTDNLVLSINSTLFNQITNLQSDVMNTYNQVMNAYSQLNDTNQTIMNKLYSVQIELANIYSLNQQINYTLNGLPSSIANISVNLTPIFDFLNIMNSTMLFGFDDTKTTIYAANSSIFGKLYLIQNDLSDIYAINQQMNGTMNTIYIDLSSMNSTIINAIYSVNSSITTELYGIRDQLQNISGDLADIILLIGDTNSSVTNQLYQIQDNINNFSSLIYSANHTIMNKLYKIQDEITSVNDSVKESNLSIMTKLYSMQTELAAINASIITTILLLSNTSFNITISQQDLFDSLVALWGDSMAKPTYSGGLTGFFIPSAEAAEDSQYICIDNMTMRRTTNIFLNSSGVPKNYDKIVDTPCTYGCKNNVCIQPDYTIFILLLLVVIGLYVLYRIFTRT